MEFDILKIQNFNDTKVNSLSSEEIYFMSKIFNRIIDSENYNSSVKYLAGIYGMSITDIELIKDVYAKYYISPEEKNIYDKIQSDLEEEKRKNGFIDLGAIISLSVLVGVIGISLVLFIYNLMY